MILRVAMSSSSVVDCATASARTEEGDGEVNLAYSRALGEGE